MNALGLDEKLQKPSAELPSLRRVCFVCTGNTCRSPMAAAVTNALAQARLKPLFAASAGLYAADGEPIAANAALALKDRGIPPVEANDYRLHTAKSICTEEAERYDLLVGMTDRHTMELILRFPALIDRITCLTPSIPDPFGGDLSCYKNCLETILEAVENLLFGDTL